METPYIAMLKFWFLASLFLIEANNSLKNNRFHFKCNNDCSRYNCRKAKDVRDDCPGGIVYGVCGCCLYCARLEGQECGAYKNAKGVCDVGLYCDVGRIRRKKLHKYASGRCKSEYFILLISSLWLWFAVLEQSTPCHVEKIQS